MEAHQHPRKLRKENASDLWKQMELGLVADEEIRNLMRVGLEKRLQLGYKPTQQQQLAQQLNFAERLRKLKMAVEVDTLNSHMYETPTALQQIICGSTLKESAGLFNDESTSLDDAQMAMMDLYCEKAGIEDGQKILDLGCGHGSLVLHVAQKFKNCHVTGVTNCVSQKEFIDDRCKELGLSNAEVILADVTTVEIGDTYDRIFVIGLIEHMKNFGLFLQKISKWMTTNGFLFLEHCCHKAFVSEGEPVGEDDWYSMFIFPPGTVIIPSASFLLYFQEDVTVMNHWILSGNNFARTHEEYLKRIDAQIDEVREILESVCGGRKEEALKVLNFWRIFCITGSETFGFNNGEEWMTSHLLFKRK